MSCFGLHEVVALQRQLTRLGFLQSHREQEVFRVWLEQHRSKYHLEEQLQAMSESTIETYQKQHVTHGQQNRS